MVYFNSNATFKKYVKIAKCQRLVYIFVSATKLLLDGFTKPLPGAPKSPGSSVGRALGF